MNQDTPAGDTVKNLTSAPPTPVGTPTKDECNMAMLAFILAIPTSWLGPLIVWLIKKDQSPFINDQGKEILNFQITLFIVYIIGVVLTFVIVGCFIVAAVVICSLIFNIMGAISASKGVPYRYPFAIRLLK